MGQKGSAKNQALRKLEGSQENLETCKNLIEEKKYGEAINYAWAASEKALKSIYLSEGGKESDVGMEIVYKNGLIDIIENLIPNLQKYSFLDELRDEIENIESAFRNIEDSNTHTEDFANKVLNNSKKVVNRVKSYINSLNEND